MRLLTSWFSHALLLMSAASAASAAETLLPGFTDTVIDSGYTTPSALGIAPDGRIFVAEQAGNVWIVVDGVRTASPFVTLPSDNSGDRGVTGICFDPDFSTNHYVYIFYTHYEPSGTTEYNCVSRFDASTNTAGPELPVFQGDPAEQTYCNGGGIGFGIDGKLYISFGDNDVVANAQSMTTTLGKLLRVNSDGTIPNDNPFYATTTGNEQAIYCAGFRNAYSLAIQPGTGVIYCNDVRGTSSDECVVQAEAGASFGYPNYDGATCPAPYTSPVFAIPYGTNAGQARCIAGGLFYVSPSSGGFPASYNGLYLFSDFMNGFIETYDPSNGTFTTVATGLNQPVQMAEDTAGNVYYCGISDDDLHCISYTQTSGTTTSTGTSTGTGTATGGTTSTGTATGGTTSTGTATGGTTSTGTATGGTTSTGTATGGTTSTGTATGGTTSTGTATGGTTSTGTATGGTTSTGSGTATATTGTGTGTSTATGASATTATSSTTGSGSTASTGGTTSVASGSSSSEPASSSSSAGGCGLGNTIGLMLALALIGLRRGLWSGSSRTVSAIVRSASAWSGRRRTGR